MNEVAVALAPECGDPLTLATNAANLPAGMKFVGWSLDYDFVSENNKSVFGLEAFAKWRGRVSFLRTSTPGRLRQLGAKPLNESTFLIESPEVFVKVRDYMAELTNAFAEMGIKGFSYFLIPLASTEEGALDYQRKGVRFIMGRLTRMASTLMEAIQAGEISRETLKNYLRELETWGQQLQDDFTPEKFPTLVDGPFGILATRAALEECRAYVEEARVSCKPKQKK